MLRIVVRARKPVAGILRIDLVVSTFNANLNEKAR